MSKSKTFLLAILVFVILGSIGSIFLFQKKEAARIEEKFSSSKDQSNEEVSTDELEKSEEDSPEAVDPVTPTTSTSTIKVSAENCEQECEGFSAIASEQAYCFSYCGLNQNQYQNSDCESLTGSEKDFCFKEKALNERNPETCARIGESSLRKVCEARLAEELFD
jgi:hypothetical protein